MEKTYFVTMTLAVGVAAEKDSEVGRAMATNDLNSVRLRVAIAENIADFLQSAAEDGIFIHEIFDSIEPAS